jgi:hypothetical protein
MWPQKRRFRHIRQFKPYHHHPAQGGGGWSTDAVDEEAVGRRARHDEGHEAIGGVCGDGVAAQPQRLELGVARHVAKSRDAIVVEMELLRTGKGGGLSSKRKRDAS